MGTEAQLKTGETGHRQRPEDGGLTRNVGDGNPLSAFLAPRSSMDLRARSASVDLAMWASRCARIPPTWPGVIPSPRRRTRNSRRRIPIPRSISEG